MKTLAVRPAMPRDRDFLRQVYASTRAEELSHTGWDDTACAAFVAMQFDAQDRHYREHFPHADYGVIELGSTGAAVQVGRLWVDRRAQSIHVLDISMLAEHRRRGLGTECLHRLMSEAASRHVALTVKVERFNPARLWYERLGFVPEDEHGMHVQMAWRADADVETKETADEQA